MSNTYGLGAYKKTSIHTASKEQVLLMLYQAAIKNCKKAIEAIDARQIGLRESILENSKILSLSLTIVSIMK